MLRLTLLRLFLPIFFGMLSVIGYWCYGIHNTFRRPTAEEFVTAITTNMKGRAPFALGTKAKGIRLSNHESFLWVDANQYPGVHSGVNCNDPKLYCILFVRGDVIAFAPEQTLENKNQYLNFTLIPVADPKHPVSLLLFPDGTVRTGKDYAMGTPAKNGIDIIKTQPAYLKNWQGN